MTGTWPHTVLQLQNQWPKWPVALNDWLIAPMHAILSVPASWQSIVVGAQVSKCSSVTTPRRCIHAIKPVKDTRLHRSFAKFFFLLGWFDGQCCTSTAASYTEKGARLPTLTYECTGSDGSFAASPSSCPGSTTCQAGTTGSRPLLPGTALASNP